MTSDTLHSVVDRACVEHYTWGSVCEGWYLLQFPDLSVILERVPAGAAETRHYHSQSRQFFYVIAGSATLELENQSATLNQGQGFRVAPRTLHRFVNRSEDEVLFLVISAPTSRGDRTNI